MSRRGSGCVRGALVLGVIAIVAMPAMAGGDPTVGSFLQSLAGHRGHQVADVRAAAAALAGDGVRLDAGIDLNRTLTEGDVVAITRSIGLKVTTQRPGADFDQEQVDALFAHFSVELRGGVPGAAPSPDTVPPPEHSNGSGPAFDPFSKGKGKGKGGVTPTDP